MRTLLPLIKANPSLASSSKGFNPILSKADFESTIFPSTNISPSPISANAICDIGAKSPQAPTDPFSQTTGVSLLFSESKRYCVISLLPPEFPFACTLIRPHIAPLTISISIGSPIPAACE